MSSANSAYLLGIATVIFAYLLGSVPGAILVSKILGLTDPRSSGSGNPGTTNVLRLSGKFAAFLVLFIDVFKGTIPVVAAAVLTHHPIPVAAAALCAFLGHLFPVYVKFKGGKGVATAIGSYLGLGIPIFLGVVAIWLLTALLSRFSSLPSLLAMLSAPILAWYFQYDPWIIGAAFIIFCFVVYRHLDNIRRLCTGKESKINLRRV